MLKQAIALTSYYVTTISSNILTRYTKLSDFPE